MCYGTLYWKPSIILFAIKRFKDKRHVALLKSFCYSSTANQTQYTYNSFRGQVHDVIKCIYMAIHENPYAV